MAVDINIHVNDFNQKFKNILRDCYVYQFKEEKDLRCQDAKKPTTLHYHYTRVRSIIENKVGIEWTEKGTNKRCVTIDGQALQENPLQELYFFASERTIDPGRDFALLYLLLIHFCPDFYCAKYPALSLDEGETLTNVLKAMASDMEGEANNRKNKCFSDISEDRQVEFAQKAIDRLLKDMALILVDPEDIDNCQTANTLTAEQMIEIYRKLIFNDQELFFDGKSFKVRPVSASSVSRISAIAAQCGINFGTQKNLEYKLQDLESLGILCSQTKDSSGPYTLSNTFLRNILPNKASEVQRFAEMVSFFATTSSLGVIGRYILKRLPHLRQNIYYKHNYLQRALSDYNLIDLLNAIKEQRWVEITYRNATSSAVKEYNFVCFPMEVCESTTDGSLHLLYYHPDHRSVLSLDIEFIDAVTVGDYENAIKHECGLRQAKRLFEKTKGTFLNELEQRNVDCKQNISEIRMIVKVDKTDDYVLRRIKRELRLQHKIKPIIFEEYGLCADITVNIANPEELIPWLRTFTSRIVLLQKNGTHWKDFFAELHDAYDMYFATKYEKRMPSGQNLQQDVATFDENVHGTLTCRTEKHTLLFNTIFSTTFDRLGKLLFTMIRKGTLDEVQKNDKIFKCAEDLSDLDLTLEMEDAVYSKTRKQAENLLSRFMQKDSAGFSALYKQKDGSSIKNHMGLLPLTSIEIQWLSNILSHPFAKCFLTEREISAIKDNLPNVNIFDVNDVNPYDQFLSSEAQHWHIWVKKILQAIRNKKKIKLEYVSRSGLIKPYYVFPSHLEYSKRSNQFSLYAVTQTDAARWKKAPKQKKKTRAKEDHNRKKAATVYHVDRIKNLTLTDQNYDLEEIRNMVNGVKDENEKHLLVKFDETKNIAIRLLTEFSCYKKRCTKTSEGEYIMTLFYEPEDAKEIASRLLRYGPYIFVSSDTGSVRKIIRGKLRDQYSLIRIIEPEKSLSKAADEPVRG